jgi:NADH-quinone oxidoreductase subunit H
VVFEPLLLPTIGLGLILAFLFEWIMRKMVARIQLRPGPLFTLPHGIGQPLADFIKLLAKEDIIHRGADRFLFIFLPPLSLVIPLFTLLCIPMWGRVAPVSFEGDLLFIFFTLTLLCFVWGLAGYGSWDRFSTVGGMRAILQLIAFEIPLILVCMGPAIAARSLSVSSIARSWWLAAQPLGFAIFIVCALAELELLPFDLPEAESEIVAGWLTEFSGKKLALFRLSRNLDILVVAGLGVALFLGGPGILGVVGFVIKTTALVVLLAFTSALFARFRIDQVVTGMWKVLIPLALSQLILAMVIR